MLSGVLLDANNTTTLEPGTAALLDLVVQLIPIFIIMAVLFSVVSLFSPSSSSKFKATIFALVVSFVLAAFNVIPFWVAMLVSLAAVVAYVLPPVSTLLPNSAAGTLFQQIRQAQAQQLLAGDVGECSKCDAMQVRLTDAERKLEKVMEESGPAFIQARELEMLKGGMRILRQRDGSEQIIFTKSDEEDWDELYDELEEANQVFDERQDVETKVATDAAELVSEQERESYAVAAKASNQYVEKLEARVAELEKRYADPRVQAFVTGLEAASKEV